METISRFLVYGLLDPCTGELRYVGKSARGMLRPKEHFKPNARIGHTHIAHWLAKLWRDSAQLPSILILKECASDLETLTCETALIALFRQCGFALTNILDGGEGAVGYKTSEATKRRLSEFTKARMSSPEERAKAGRAHIGSKHSAATRARMRAAQRAYWARINELGGRKGRRMSVETRAKMSAARRADWAARASAGVRLHREVRQETRKKLSDASKAQWICRTLRGDAPTFSERRHGPATLLKMRESALVREQRKRDALAEVKVATTFSGCTSNSGLLP